MTKTYTVILLPERGAEERRYVTGRVVAASPDEAAKLGFVMFTDTDNGFSPVGRTILVTYICWTKAYTATAVSDYDVVCVS